MSSLFFHSGMQALTECLVKNHTLTSLMVFGNTVQDSRAEDIVAMRVAAKTALTSHPDRIPLALPRSTSTDIYGFGFKTGNSGSESLSPIGKYLPSYYDMPFAAIPEDEVFLTPQY